MIYYKKNMDKSGKTIIVRYEINFDEEKVKELRNEIVYNCSEKHDVEAILGESEINSYYNNNEHILNFKKGKFEFKKKNLKSPTSEEYYHCSYTLLIYPDIINFIDRLLNDDIYIKDEINNDKNYYTSINNLKKEIFKLNNEINKIDNLDVDIKINKLLEFKNLMNKYKYEEKMHEYYNELNNLISIDKMGEMYQDDLDKVVNFFDDINILKRIK